MQQPSPVRRRLRPGPLLLVVGSALLSASAPGAAGADDADDDDRAPPGMVAYFLASGPDCPRGWVPAAEARGRLVVGVTGSVDVGVQVGAPLSDKEDRAHRHAFSGQGALPYKA